ncbi:hypothetical protein HDU96_004305 [Phlyctochytrium bullatum]|nr:hypothetical protein HDU96_004305 [Phlyctochytrium bullatum]
MAPVGAFWALLRKNYAIFRSKTVSNITMLYIFPVFLIFSGLQLRQNEITGFETGVGRPQQLDLDLSKFSGASTLVFADDRAPDRRNPGLQTIVDAFQKFLGARGVSLHVATSGLDLLRECSPTPPTYKPTRSCWAGVTFTNLANENGQQWNYTLSFDSKAILPKVAEKYNVNKDLGLYPNAGLAQLQILLDRVLLRLSANVSTESATVNARLDAWEGAAVNNVQILSKTLADQLRPFYGNVKVLGAIVVLAAFLPHVSWMAINMLLEKEANIKEAMVIMGMQEWMYTASWILSALAFSSFSFVLSGVAFWFLSFPSSSLVVCIVFILVAGSALLAFTLTTTVLLTKARMAGLIATSLTLVCGQKALTRNPNSIASVVAANTTTGMPLLAMSAALPSGLIIFGIRLLASAEDNTTPVTLSNLTDSTLSDDKLSMMALILAGLISFLFHILLTLLLEKVVVPFLNDPARFLKGLTDRAADEDLATENPGLNPRLVEESGGESKPTISLRGLTKRYPGSPVKSVDGLSLEMYENQVLCLLGRNGCGKSSRSFRFFAFVVVMADGVEPATIGMLSGLIDPSGGDAVIHGRSIKSAGRTSVGFCPQQNILWEDLSVYETLMVYAGIKGVPSGQIDAEIDSWLEVVGIPEKRSSAVKTLSGGQKRKVCLCIAFMGGSKVVFLDEPTAGVDPFSRRSMWEIVAKNKSGRTIILTTHFLDEADILGDRIAIMDLGALKALGTSTFLKDSFNVGYRLAITLETEDSGSPSAAAASVRSTISQFIPQAREQNATLPEMSFNIPLSANNKFSSLFAALEQPSAGVKDFDLAMSTLDDVFLKLVNEAVDEDLLQPLVKRSHSIVERARLRPSGPSVDSVTALEKGHFYENFRAVDFAREDVDKPIPSPAEAFTKPRRPSFVVQFFALLRKRFFLSIRDLRFTLVPLFMCAGLCIGIYELGKKSERITCPAGDISIETFRLTPISQALTTNSLLADAVAGFAVGGDVFVAAVAAKWASAASPVSKINVTSKIPTVGSLQDLLASDRIAFNTLASVVFTDRKPDGAVVGATIVHDEMKNFSTPLAVNVLSNAVWASSAGADASRPLIEMAMQPWPALRVLTNANGDFNFGLFSGFLAMVGWPICITVLAGIWVVREKELGAKDQQRYSGVSGFAYWSSSIVFDAVQVAILSVAVAGVFHATPGFLFPFALTFVTFFAIGLSICLFSGIFSFMFTKPASSIIGMFMYLITSAYVGAISWFLTLSTTDQNPFEKAEKVEYVAMFFSPSFTAWHSVFYGANVLYMQCNNNYDLGQPTSNTLEVESKMWDLKVMGTPLLIVLGQIVVLSVVIGILESWPAISAFFRSTRLEPPIKYAAAWNDPNLQPKSPSVLEEEATLLGGGPLVNTAMVLKRLLKVYRSGWKRSTNFAVRDVTFSILKNECFVLLGTNGAGKTSTLKMACGQSHPTSGQIELPGKTMSKNLSSIQRIIGVTPQFDALWPSLTVREHMQLYCDFRGVPASSRKAVVEYLIDSLDLRIHERKRSAELSGGNRRKLSLAIALIGAPDVVILDEPSTGMDPSSKRKMWKVILELRSRLSMILTTHSMEEAEALANKYKEYAASRIGVMVTGRLVALGTQRRLQQEHSNAYQIQVRCASADGAATFVTALRSRLPHGSNLAVLEQHIGTVRLEVKKQLEGPVQRVPVLKLSELFEAVESINAACGVLDYQIGNTSLEQIFLRLAAADSHRG